MYVYPVVRTYSTGVSVVYSMCSSAKKAADLVEHLLSSAQDEGWDVDHEWLASTTYPTWRSKTGRMAKGAAHNVELFHYEKHEVV